MPRGIAFALAAAVVLAGCGSAAGEAGDAGDASTRSPMATVTTAPPVAVVTGPVPAAFRNRTPLPSCGTYDARPVPKADTPPAQESGTCFERAIGTAAGAELVVRQVTVEGDPIATYVRALPGSTRIEVFSDNTADDFGTKVWTRQTCTGLDSAWFSPTGCSEPEDYLARSITGRWLPREIYATDFPARPSSAPEFALRFEADGTWAAADRCDGTTGTFRVDEVGTFAATTTSVAPTGRCDPGDVVGTMTKTSRVVVTSDLLRFLSADGDILADFVPA